MAGAHDAKYTFLAPASLAMPIISLEVVPRTIESEMRYYVYHQLTRQLFLQIPSASDSTFFSLI
jgi:hypothetical protein